MCVDDSSSRTTSKGPSDQTLILGKVDGGRDNNMDFMRFVAASMVIYAHAFNLAGDRDPLESVTGMSSGSLAVAVFFSLSGYLIARSLLNRDSLLEFCLARGLRILPALVVANILAIVAGGLIWTRYSAGDYWSSAQTWKYLVLNSSLVKNTYELPGVFESNVYGPAVNGSLWTLPVEARMYALVLLAGVLSLTLGRTLRFGRTGWVTGVGLVGLGLSCGLWKAMGIPYGNGVLSESGVKLLGVFSFGMALQGVRERVCLSGWVVLAGAVAVFLVRETAVFDSAFVIWLPYACLWLAYTRRINARGFGRHGDLSYGIYVYAFPIQQWIYARDPAFSPLWNAAVTFVAVLVLAYISWRIIERPALGSKKAVHQWLVERGIGKSEAGTA